MKYRTNPKNGDQLSALGFGCMRFSKDKEDVEKQILYAIENGVNYFDTAYLYGGSEATLGNILNKNNLRDQVKIATKVPPYLVRKLENIDKIFNTQLARLQTDHIDYYLTHMLSNVNSWNKFKEAGIVEWVAQKKEAGQIHNFGFSFHGVGGDFIKIIDAYDWDFCMIQYNYMDENNQAGKKGLHYATQKGIPVIVMEPLRGGQLANKLPLEALAVWNTAVPKCSPAEWGLRWVWNQPEVLTVLSGMGSMDMVEENIRIASEAEPNSLTEADMALYDTVRKIYMEKTVVPCTGCSYCMPCPAGVDIPACFACYNEKAGGGKHAGMNYILYTGDHNASRCVECGKCEPHCPQDIAIRKNLADTAKKMEGPLYKPMRFVVRKVLKQG